VPVRVRERIGHEKQCQRPEARPVFLVPRSLSAARPVIISLCVTLREPGVALRLTPPIRH